MPETLKIELSDNSVRRIADIICERLILAKNEQSMGNYLRTKEAAEFLGVSVNTIRKHKSKLPHIKSGDSKQSMILFEKDKLKDAWACHNIID